MGNPAPQPLLTPGVYFVDVPPSTTPTFETGVPAFLGWVSAAAAQDSLFAPQGSPPSAVAELDVSAWSQLVARVGAAWAEGFLGYAVRGFFQNGGKKCYVVAVPSGGQPTDVLGVLDTIQDLDLVCVPDAAPLQASSPALETQAQIVSYCGERGDRFAILDAIGDPAGASPPAVSDLLADVGALVGLLPDPAAAGYGALYAPWIRVACLTCAGAGSIGSGPCPVCGGQGSLFVPPSGHVAGIYAQTDASTGVFKAPANAVLSGVTDLEILIDAVAQQSLNPAGVNCVRALPGRGIRVFGARTLSADPSWTFINVARLLVTVARWLEQFMIAVAFEPNTQQLWVRISRQVTSFLNGLYTAGALQGTSPDEAFFVKCDAETNPPSVRAAGYVVTEVGIAAALPAEFIVVRLTGGPGGITVSSLPGVGRASASPSP